MPEPNRSERYRAPVARSHDAKCRHGSVNNAQVRDLGDTFEFFRSHFATGEKTDTIALLIQISIGPKSDSIVSAAAST